MPITEKTKDAQEIASRGVSVLPLGFTVRDVQEYVQRLEDQSYQPTPSPRDTE